MSISTYSDLKTAIDNWTDDADAAIYADTYIDLVEVRLNQELRVAQMEATATITLTDGEGDLPADFLEARRVESVTNPVVSMDYVTPEVLTAMYPQTTSGWPQYYTIRGDKVVIRPTAGSVKLYYYQTIPALSDAQTTNWLLTKSPGLYLYGCEYENAWRTRNYERASAAQGRFQVELDALQREDKGRRWPNAVARIKGITP